MAHEWEDGPVVSPKELRAGSMWSYGNEWGKGAYLSQSGEEKVPWTRNLGLQAERERARSQ